MSLPARRSDDRSGAPSGAASVRLPRALGDDATPGSLRHAAHEAVLTIDAAQRVVMINPAAQRMFGCSAEEALGSDLARFIPQRLREAHARHVQDFADSGAAERAMGERMPVRGVRANGEEFPAAVTIVRTEGAGAFGAGVYFTALVCDLTVEQGLREALESVRRRFEAVFELLPNALWIAEGDRIVFANRACEALFAAPTRAHLLGRPLHGLMAEGSQAGLRAAMTEAATTGRPVAMVQERIERFDGQARDVEIALAP
ncbi:MAG TPA: PAS domain-containing protein, partial [Burkholderiaceae bacterium]|nr:PAS domain-containing protein [Burkholderiaceae bacterium]